MSTSIREVRQERRVKADPSMISTLMDMGFTKSQCKAVLKQTKNDLEKSLDKLLNNGEAYIGLENSDDSADEGDASQAESAQMREQRLL